MSRKINLAPMPFTVALRTHFGLGRNVWAHISCWLKVFFCVGVLFLSNANSAGAKTPSHNKAVTNEAVTKVEHSFLSCAIITSEYLTALQLLQRGVSLQEAQSSLPKISRNGKKRLKSLYESAKKHGVLNTYADIHTNLARCASLVYQRKGLPAKDTTEYGYYYCAGEDKARFEILLYLDKGYSEEKIKTLVNPKHYEQIDRLKSLVTQKGMLAAFDLLSNNLKACIANIQPL